MTALPASTVATASAATEGDVKNFLTGQRDYLSGLFGDTGVAADARAALGVAALTSANIAAALGYTPANPANAGTDHNHTGTYAPMTAFVSVSRYSSGYEPNINYYHRFTRANGSTQDVLDGY